MIRYLLFLLCFVPSLFAHDTRILGLGAPCLDYIIKVDETELSQFGLKKGGWHEVDASTIDLLINQKKTPHIYTGDCVSNTIKGLASLGISCSLTGNIGNDASGVKIRTVFKELGISTIFTQTASPTAQIAGLVTPDGERSFCAYVKPEKEITEKDLKPEHFENIDLVYLSGFCLPNGAYTEKAFTYAKKTGALVSYDLGNVHLVDSYRERLWAALPEYVDILFANEQEAYALTHLPPEKAAAFLKNFCQIVVVKIGDEGCWVCSKEGLFHSPAIKAGRVIDTTGAGDIFASAFLYAFLEGAPPHSCAYLGNLAGSAAVERHGAELAPEKWGEILTIFEKTHSR